MIGKRIGEVTALLAMGVVLVLVPPPAAGVVVVLVAPNVGMTAVGALLATGVTREALIDAFYVAFLFNTYDRLADTLGWELPDRRYYPKAGQLLLKRGYL